MDTVASMFARRDRTYVELGIALAPAAPSAVAGAAATARTVLVELVPSGRVLSARVANPGQGLGKGVFVPIQKGDELLVLFPGGDPNRSVALAAMGNGVNVNPAGNLGTNLLALHPGGVTLGTVDGAPEYSIVHTELLSALSDFMVALATFMGACTSATGGAAGIAAAATTFQADPAVTGLTAGLTASQSAGAPYATTLHKVSA